MRMSRTPRSGMTLMELIVALVVTGMVAAIGASAFSTVVDSRSRTREVTYGITNAAATRAVLVSWLSSGRVSAIAERMPNATGLNLADDDDALLVVATTSTPLNSGETVVHMYIDRDEETPEKGLVAELESLDLASDEVQTTINRVVQLDSTVSGLLLEYLDEQSRRWIPRREAAVRSPVAVRMTLSATYPDTLPSLLQLPIVQPMPRATGRGNSGNRDNDDRDRGRGGRGDAGGGGRGDGGGGRGRSGGGFQDAEAIR